MSASRTLAWLPLALLLAIPTPARAADCNANGVDDLLETDSDADGVIDACDNCPLAANGPPEACDSDGDDMGNACDCDFDNDGACGSPDFAVLVANWGVSPADLSADANCDGVVGAPDFAAFAARFGGVPGPGLPPPPLELAINFQPAAVPVPAGFELDAGLGFGDRPNGERYGWKLRLDGTPVDASAATRDRDVAGVAQEVDTLQHLQRGDCCATGFVDEIFWEIELPDGSYDVTVAAGDAQHDDSTHFLNVEGVSAIANGVQSGATPILGSVTVDVTDGLLTIDADGGTNTKIHYVEISSAGVTPPPPPPPGGCVPNPSQFDGASVSPLACSEVKVDVPYALDWATGEGGIEEGAGVGTGFTMVLPTTNGDGLLPENAAVTGGRLELTTTPGILFGTENSQDNALGVGLPLPDAAYRITTTLTGPPAGSGSWEQAGLWFGISERDYLKLILASSPSGTLVQALVEESDATSQSADVPVTLPASIELELVVDPTAETATAAYTIGGSRVELGSFALPSLWFSKDAAGIDFNVGTRSYVGISATQRQRDPVSGPLVYAFDDFLIEEVDTGGPGPGPGPSAVDFERWTIGGIGNPTALVWGPDDRLYAATAGGTIYAYTLDRDAHTVLDTETISAVAGRLVLGLTVDPLSTPDDVILWASHSDIQQSSGDANSGVMSRLSGPGFGVREDRITGIARAIANHAPNSLHWSGGYLYMVIGGNTGAGASNDGGSEFGPRPEQPTSAAILRADPYAPGFDGDCTSLVDPDGTQMDATGISARDLPCDVELYATGLRNSYDFVPHTNGRMYATDNGLGVEGTVPDLPPGWSPGESCEGPINGQAARDAHNPGRRPDLLYEVQQGDYFGHPDPARDECVFFGGNPTANPDWPIPATGGGTDFLDTDVYPAGQNPEADWKPAMWSFGTNKSANGIIEYTANSFCGALSGDLLVAYYSQQDQIRRLSLSPDGLSVVADETLPRTTSGSGGSNLSNPLPIAQDPQGNVYVGEFGGGRIAVLDPIGPGCWQETGPADAPEALLDAAGTAIGDRLYAVAGKTAAGHQSTLYVYDAGLDTWTQGASLPAAYPAVENAAAVEIGGLLYVFGGGTAAFSGAVAKAAFYDPDADAWTLLPDMPTARSGPAAAVVNGLVYVVGGMDASGTSLASMDVFDPVAGSWSSGPAMAMPRDNPMAAAVNGELIVAGGRTRQAAPFPDDDTLSSVEIYDPVADGWSSGAPLPTGRRTGGAVVVDGEVLFLGGERTPSGGSFVAVEVYDPLADSWSALPDMPVGRHGAVWGRIGSAIYVATGGPTGGSAFTADVDVLHYR